MPWNSQSATQLLIVNASPGFTGLFVYSPSPGTGNLIASSTATAGTDPYGNAYLAGITSYGTGVASQQFFNLQGGFATLSDSASHKWLIDANANFTSPVMRLQSLATLTPLFVSQAGTAITTQPGTSNPETWHAPATAGFTTAAGVQPVEYTLLPDGNVAITGQMNASGAYTAGTTIWTMPAGYRPSTNAANVGVTIDTAGALSVAWLGISTAGTVSIPFNVANAAAVIVTGGPYRLAV